MTGTASPGSCAAQRCVLQRGPLRAPTLCWRLRSAGRLALGNATGGCTGSGSTDRRIAGRRHVDLIIIQGDQILMSSDSESSDGEGGTFSMFQARLDIVANRAPT